MSGGSHTLELPHRRTLTTVEDTEAFGAELAAELHAGDLVITDGPLGAGKTALARGIGAGLGVTGRVTSPTFIIARAHAPGRPGAAGMVHVDAYRLGSTGGDVLADLDGLDLDTEITDNVVVVEWGAGVAERLADRHLLVRLRREPDSDVRTATWGWVRSADGSA
ncbi:tRNA (adenosine(37)-N6)-threonylcarbamoyltransferase complex ATPase subunit type 1 TsaE [Williamsia sp.]|uniref:tRNA (adenosine(37)-N6)-threonylcarbamoyltransferase complex ATPase subunit type 1 TsaE n=1 Tax=Williamsia sp. TaxID=1872085 RepID=UPI001A1DEDA9|nr:tRNA (adenosine(37)-N6)-threonylcarbamoyltransferase complex ATPase subunit type 1 TsaE [Williamsia sp.]MBJ7290648.1 tRNA (adenosine(37)-N6)-threonylcarbamoyltransferase complex ATPase subunit type 1 TsaE [Williamsia sp.]